MGSCQWSKTHRTSVRRPFRRRKRTRTHPYPTYPGVPRRRSWLQGILRSMEGNCTRLLSDRRAAGSSPALATDTAREAGRREGRRTDGLGRMDGWMDRARTYERRHVRARIVRARRSMAVNDRTSVYQSVDRSIDRCCRALRQF